MVHKGNNIQLYHIIHELLLYLRAASGQTSEHSRRKSYPANFLSLRKLQARETTYHTV